MKLIWVGYNWPKRTVGYWEHAGILYAEIKSLSEAVVCKGRHINTFCIFHVGKLKVRQVKWLGRGRDSVWVNHLWGTAYQAPKHHLTTSTTSHSPWICLPPNLKSQISWAKLASSFQRKRGIFQGALVKLAWAWPLWEEFHLPLSRKQLIQGKCLPLGLGTLNSEQQKVQLPISSSGGNHPSQEPELQLEPPSCSLTLKCRDWPMPSFLQPVSPSVRSLHCLFPCFTNWFAPQRNY